MLGAFQRLRDPNRVVRFRAGYPKLLRNGTWVYVLEDRDSGAFVANRLGHKTRDEAVEHAAAYYNLDD